MDEQAKLITARYFLQEMAKSSDDKREFRRNLTAFLNTVASIQTDRESIVPKERQTLNSAEALRLLKEGNDRFCTGTAIHPHSDRQWIAGTDGHQEPFAAVITCSDSRVSPELIFDRGIGDIFVVREAGNVMAPVVIGSIEYAVERLHTSLVVVMGHTHCGAMEEAVRGEHEGDSIDRILDKISPSVTAVKSRNGGLQGDNLIVAATQANVRNSIADLLRNSPEILQAVNGNRIRIIGALYNTSTAKVTWLG